MSNEVVTYQGTENVVVYSSADNAVHLDVQLADETGLADTATNSDVIRCTDTRHIQTSSKYIPRGRT